MQTTKRPRPLPLLEALEPRNDPCASLGNGESFDSAPPGQLPAGWSQWSSTGTNAFAVSSSRALSAPSSLAASSPLASGLNARAWLDAAQPADVQVDAAVYLNTS